jgi:hypothetical protein
MEEEEAGTRVKSELKKYDRNENALQIFFLRTWNWS